MGEGCLTLGRVVSAGRRPYPLVRRYRLEEEDEVKKRGSCTGVRTRVGWLALGALCVLALLGLWAAWADASPSVRVVYRAHADVNGDGHADLVTLKTGSVKVPGRLNVALASGPRLAVKIPTTAVSLPGLVSAGNVDGRRGAELFVDLLHVTTAEQIGAYTYWHGQLRLAGTFSAYGNDFGIRYGITCATKGSKRLIVEHEFLLSDSKSHQWTRRDTQYDWHGPALDRIASGHAKAIHGGPPPGLVGVHCGHSPAP
jgi:hypothetical protein